MPRSVRSRTPTPAIFSGSTTFSSTVASGTRKNCWKTNPKSRLRSRWMSRWLRPAASCPLMRTAPASGASSSASRCMSVDLAEPDLPTIATDSPCSMRSETPRSAWKRLSPLP